MAHNTLVRADLAAWSVATPVTPAEFWKLDENQYKSINGDDGGTWAPAAAIVIGGAGIELTGSNHVLGGGTISGSWAGSPTTTGAWTFNGATFDVNSASSTFSGSVVFETALTLDSAALIASGACSINGTFSGNPTWSGTHTWSGTITSSGGTLSGTWAGGPTWTGTHSFQSTVGFSGSVTHTGNVALSGTGKIRERVVSGADSDQTYDADDADMIRVGTLSNSRTYTIGSGTSGEKLTITKMYQAAAHTITLSGTIDTLGGTLPVIKNQSSGDMCSITLRCYGPGWCIEQATFVP